MPGLTDTTAADRPLWIWTTDGHMFAAARLPREKRPALYCREGDRRWSPADPANLAVIGGAETIERFAPKPKGGTS
jgi:hypothetical protein